MNFTPEENRVFKAERGDFRSRRLLVIAAGLSLLIAPFLWRAVFREGGPTLCSFRSILGLPCPGCGLTRAFCALSVFDYWEALRANAVSIPLALLASAAPLVAATEILRGQRFSWYHNLFTKRVAIALLFSLIIYHGARVCYWIYDGTLFKVYFKSGELYRVFSVYCDFFD